MKIHNSLLRHQMEMSGQLHASATVPLGKSPRTHWIGRSVGPIAGLDSENLKSSFRLRAIIVLPASNQLG
jgi:hypothetical protein